VAKLPCANLAASVASPPTSAVVRVVVALGLEDLVALDRAELADRAVDRADQVGLRERARAGLQRPREELVEALVVLDVRLERLAHVHAVLRHEAPDDPRRDSAPLLARDPAGEIGQGLFGEQVLGQYCGAVGHVGRAWNAGSEGHSIKRFPRQA
jgi:hypothetical protein